MCKFNVGDIVTIRNDKELGRIKRSPVYDDGTWWYEVEAVNLQNVPTREVKEEDLRREN